MSGLLEEIEERSKICVANPGARDDLAFEPFRFGSVYLKVESEGFSKISKALPEIIQSDGPKLLRYVGPPNYGQRQQKS